MIHCLHGGGLVHLVRHYHQLTHQVTHQLLVLVPQVRLGLVLEEEVVPYWGVMGRQSGLQTLTPSLKIPNASVMREQDLLVS